MGDAGSAATYVCCEQPWFETEGQIAKRNLERIVAAPDFVNLRCPSTTTVLTFWGDSIHRRDVDPASISLPHLQQLMWAIDQSSIDYLILGNISGLCKCLDQLFKLAGCCKTNDVQLLLTVGSETKLFDDSSNEDFLVSSVHPEVAQLDRQLDELIAEYEAGQESLPRAAG